MKPDMEVQNKKLKQNKNANIILIIMYFFPDPRTADWFMVSSPVPSLIICALYPFVILIGKAYMKNREPFQINNILKVYNFVLVIASAWMVYEFLMGGWLYEYGISCQPVDRSNSPEATRMAVACWVYFISKFPELLDTVFFVMRKKNNQITFLHVFHHGEFRKL